MMLFGKQIFSKTIIYIISLFFLVFLINQYINQNVFKNTFGFYLTNNFYTLKASLFDCMDCNARYLSFQASESVISKIVANEDCHFEKYNYKVHGDYLGSIEYGAPSFWKECIKGDVCVYKKGGLWYNKNTHLMCYGHILL